MTLLMVFVSVLLAVTGLMGYATADTEQDCKCPSNILNYYKELRCTPENEDAACCPTKHECGSNVTNRELEKCYLRGEEFSVGDVITSQQTGHPCVPECQCTTLGSPQEGASFHCTHIDCPDLFHDDLEVNCVRQYAADQCCSTGVHCSTDKEEFTCSYANRTYVLGQLFHQRELPCKKCICQEGYDGTLNGPWCTDINCGIEIHHGGRIRDGCAPIFYGTNGCCPIGWRCSNSADTVVPAPAAAPTARTTAKCAFGQLELNVSETLSKSAEDKNCMTCTCSVPPHVTCIRKGYSGDKAEGLSDNC